MKRVEEPSGRGASARQSKTRRFGNYSCMNLWKSRPSYSSPSRIPVFCTNMVNTSRLESNRGIRVFDHLWVKVNFILKTSPNIRYSTRYLTRYLTRGQVTRPQSINFTIRLQLDLGHWLLVFALTTNLESGPRFFDMWCQLKSVLHQIIVQFPSKNRTDWQQKTSDNQTFWTSGFLMFISRELADF